MKIFKLYILSGKALKAKLTKAKAETRQISTKTISLLLNQNINLQKVIERYNTGWAKTKGHKKVG